MLYHSSSDCGWTRECLLFISVLRNCLFSSLGKPFFCFPPPFDLQSHSCLQFFVLLAPTALIDAIVQCYNITSSKNPAFPNYQVIKKLMGPSHVPYSAQRELLPFRALVRAYMLPLPAPAGYPSPTLSDLLPFFRGSVVGLAPLSARGSLVARALTQRPRPKLVNSVLRLADIRNETNRQARAVVFRASHS
jgi:hypothetical protein